MSEPKKRDLIMVGVSGGVDSAVSLALIKKQLVGGGDCKAIFMRNWSEDLPGFKCPWREDWFDAQSVALKLGVKIDLWDFEKDYKQKVVDYLLAEYRAGRTPNPDIVCNQEVKFKVFLEKALEVGANKIATGHYARIVKEPGADKDRFWLQMAKDKSKDQSYFLARMSQAALSKTIFPLGDMLKSEVRKIAKDLELHNAAKKDSVGICFVGEVGVKDFLKNFLDLKSGAVIDIKTELEVGRHEGSELYTIGQRHGLDLSGGGNLPYYVVRKDLERNIVYVSDDLNNKELWTEQLLLDDIHMPTINLSELKLIAEDKKMELYVRTRHLGELIKIKSLDLSGDKDAIIINLSNKIKRPASGQTGVVYDAQQRVVLAGFLK